MTIPKPARDYDRFVGRFTAGTFDRVWCARGTVPDEPLPILPTVTTTA